MSNQHNQVCPVCGINKFDGTFIFATGKSTTPQDVAGLICAHKGSKEGCINPCQRNDLGTSWLERAKTVERLNDRLLEVQIFD